MARSSATNGSESDRDTLRRFLRTGVYALIVLSPLPFASVQPWAVLTLQVGVCVLGAGALWLWSREPGLLDRRSRTALACIAVVLGVGLIQLVPIPAGWVEILAEPTHRLRTELHDVLPETASGSASLSLAPAHTVDAMLRLATWTVLAFVTVVSFVGARHVRTALWLIVGSAAFQAVYGVAEHVSGRQHIFAYAKRYDVDAATGTFINSNHFAGFLAMAFPLTLGLLVTQTASRDTKRAVRARLVSAIQSATPATALVLFAATMIWLGILLSYSRGGLAAALFGVIVVLFMIGGSRRRIAVLGFVALVPIVVLANMQVRAPGENLIGSDSELSSLGLRLPIWKATAELIPDYLLLGAGLGTYEATFYPSKPPGFDVRVDHAHNDWLEALLEGGVLTLSAMAVLAVVLVWGRGHSTFGGTAKPVLAASLRASLLVLAFQSLADFSARIPAVAVLGAIVAGLALGRSSWWNEESGDVGPRLVRGSSGFIGES